MSSHLDDDARQAMASALEKARLALESLRDQLAIAIEQGVLDGYIGEERARLLEILEAIDPGPRATWLAPSGCSKGCAAR